MGTVVRLVRRLSSLVAADPESEEALLGLKPGEVYRSELTKSRHAPWFRKFWALLKVIYPHQDLYPTRERLRKAILVALGFCSTFTLPDGRVVIEADSMAWGKMKEEEFDILMEKFFQLVETKILPRIARADVEREWNEVMLGYKDAGLNEFAQPHNGPKNHKGGRGERRGAGSNAMESPNTGGSHAVGGRPASAPLVGGGRSP